MSHLLLPPFELRPNEPITVRVAGRDGIEFGPWSNAVSGIKMLDKPKRMEKVKYEEGIISWREVVGGSTPITGYQLFSNAGLVKSVASSSDHVSGMWNING